MRGKCLAVGLILCATAALAGSSNPIQISTPVSPALGGTGVNNGTNTLTVPATGTVALLGQTQTFTAAQTINRSGAALLASANLTIQPPDGNTNPFVINSSNGGAGYIKMLTTGGTFAAQTALTANAVLGGLQLGGYDGTALEGATGYFTCNAAQNWANGSTYATACSIGATPASSTAGEVEATFYGGIAAGSGTPQGVGTVNATNGLYAGLSSSTAALDYACFNSATKAFTYDASGTCLVSSLRFKHDVRPIVDPIGKVMAIRPIEFVYNDQSVIAGPQMGVSAESVAAAVPMLATRDAKGRPEKVKYIEMIGLLTAAMQAQQREIDELRHHRTRR